MSACQVQAAVTGFRSRPDQLSIFVSANDAQSRLQRTLNALVIGVLSDNDSINVHRIIGENCLINFWPEDYIQALDVGRFSNETHLRMQLLDAQTGRISFSDAISLSAMAETQLTQV